MHASAFQGLHHSHQPKESRWLGRTKLLVTTRLLLHLSLHTPTYTLNSSPLGACNQPRSKNPFAPRGLLLLPSVPKPGAKACASRNPFSLPPPPGHLYTPTADVDTIIPTHYSEMTDSSAIDPRLQYASSLPPRTLSQSYPAGPALQNNAAGHQPYYLPTTVHPQTVPLSQAAPPSNVDPSLEQTSPVEDHGSPDDDEHELEGDHDGFVSSHIADVIIRITDLHSAHETPGSAKSPGDFKRPRACDSCRGLKVSAP